MTHETLEERLRAVREFLVAYWMKKGNPKWLAEEAAQEGTLKAWLKAGLWKGRNNAKLQTFLITVGITAGIDYLRREARQVRIKQRLSDSSGWHSHPD